VFTQCGMVKSISLASSLPLMSIDGGPIQRVRPTFSYEISGVL
jgi:hypothetical protein